jgi:hypothetical protein
VGDNCAGLPADRAQIILLGRRAGGKNAVLAACLSTALEF